MFGCTSGIHWWLLGGHFDFFIGRDCYVSYHWCSWSIGTIIKEMHPVFCYFFLSCVLVWYLFGFRHYKWTKKWARNYCWDSLIKRNCMNFWVSYELGLLHNSNTWKWAIPNCFPPVAIQEFSHLVHSWKVTLFFKEDVYNFHPRSQIFPLFLMYFLIGKMYSFLLNGKFPWNIQFPIFLIFPSVNICCVVKSFKIPVV